MKVLTFCAGALALAAPILAHADEEIGTLVATFGDEQISQPTVIAKRGNEESPTAYLLQIGAGMSALNFFGYIPGKARLDVNMTYMKEVPDAQTPPIDMTIQYTPPDAGKSYWTSDDAPTAPQITFTTLELDGDQGRALGSFSAVLCFADSYESGPDTANCRPIEGTVDTRFFVEKPK